VKKKLILFTSVLVILLVVAGAVALAQTEPGNGIQGFITSISGTVVLVEENPADEWGSNKGAFTVTGETQILRDEGGELVPAAFGDLQVGQLVVATYAGPVAESYPTQGTASSIVILGESYGDEPGDDDQLLCLLPEGCDTDGDGVPDLAAGEPAPPQGGTGAVQYDNTA
jgi:hypothetical protein